MSEDPVLVARPSPGVARVTLNRPRALNAISMALESALRERMRALDADSGVHAIVLTGAGRAFSAGVDLKEVGKLGFASRQRAPDEPSTSELFAALATPVIAAVNGFAITGGFELALMCDIRIAADTAQFADTHARVGVVPGWGLSQRLPRCIGTARAKELSLTGNYLDARTACEWGIVNRVVPEAELAETALALAGDVAGAAGPVQAEIKRLIELAADTGLTDGLHAERQAADAHNVGVAAADIESRRAGVVGRGREQR